MELKKMAIAVCTCDAYSDVIPAFFHFFRKNWPDCPYEVYVISECVNYDSIDHNITTINNTDSSCTWSQRLRHALTKIPYENIFIILDDFFVLSKIENNKIDECLELLAEPSRAYIGFHHSRTVSKNECEVGNYVRRKDDEQYWVSLLPAIWKKKALLDLLSPYEDPWQFEWFGTERAKLTKWKFYELAKDAPFVVDFNISLSDGYGLCQGKWTSKTKQLFRSNHINIDTDIRGYCTEENRLAKTKVPKMLFRHRMLYFLYGGLPHETYLEGKWRMSVAYQIKRILKYPGFGVKIMKTKLTYLLNGYEGKDVFF